MNFFSNSTGHSVERLLLTRIRNHTEDIHTKDLSGMERSFRI